jgi:hypothetical protein
VRRRVGSACGIRRSAREHQARHRSDHRHASHHGARIWRVDSNALFEKPFSTGRDAVDLITTVEVARRLTSAVDAGIELIGEDLEGFWDADEMEDGATRSARASTATHALPTGDDRDGFAVRVSFGYGF